MPTQMSWQPAREMGTAVLVKGKAIPRLQQTARAEGTMTMEPIRELMQKGPKRPSTSLTLVLLILTWMTLMQMPQRNPVTEPIIMRIPILQIRGAAAPMTIPPVMVPTKTYLQPTRPWPTSAEPMKVPMMLPIMPKKMENLEMLSPTEFPQYWQFTTQQEVNTKVAKMKAVPICESSSERRLNSFLGCTSGRDCLRMRQLKGRPKKTAKTQTQLVPNMSKKQGLKMASLWSWWMTLRQTSRQKLQHQAIMKKEANLTICTVPTRPTTAVITVMMEMTERKVMRMRMQPTSMLLELMQVQNLLTDDPVMLVLTDPNPVRKMLMNSFCSSGDSWMQTARTRKQVAEPSQFPNLYTLRSMPKPVVMNRNMRMRLMISVLSMVMASASALKTPDSPQPIMTPISVTSRLTPRNLLLLSAGSVYVRSLMGFCSISSTYKYLFNIFYPPHFYLYAGGYRTPGGVARGELLFLPGLNCRLRELIMLSKQGYRPSNDPYIYASLLITIFHSTLAMPMPSLNHASRGPGQVQTSFIDFIELMGPQQNQQNLPGPNSPKLFPPPTLATGIGQGDSRNQMGKETKQCWIDKIIDRKYKMRSLIWFGVAMVHLAKVALQVPVLSSGTIGEIFKQNKIYMIYVTESEDILMESYLNEYCHEGKLCAILNKFSQKFSELRDYISWDGLEYFTIIDSARKAKYVMPVVEGMTAVDLHIFHSKFEQGLLDPFYSSEEKEEQVYEPCRKVVGKDLDLFLANEAPLKVLFLYSEAQYCENCGQLLRRYADFAQRLYDNKTIIFGYYNVLRNDHPRIKDEIFPYFLVYGDGDAGETVGIGGEQLGALEQKIVDLVTGGKKVHLQPPRPNASSTPKVEMEQL